jgi:hypothetical protein
MADRIDTAMHHMKAPALNPPLDCAGSDTGAEQLAASHHAMLAPRHSRNQRVRLRLTPYMRVKLKRVGD